MVRKLKGRDPKSTKAKKPKILIFGKPGVGKTWTALDFPDVYYIDTEAGADLPHYTDKLQASGAAYLGPRDGSQDYQTVIEEVMTLATTKHEHKTLVIDSFTKLFNTASAEEEERLINGNQKVEFSREKKPAVRSTRRLIRWLDKIDMNVILVCHEKDQWHKGEVIDATFDGWDKLGYELHLVMQIQKRGDSRVAVVKKSRLMGFPDGSTFKWTYKQFAEQYGVDIVQSPSEAIVVATPEQVARLKSLIQAGLVDDETVEKCKEKAGVISFEDMTGQDIQKWIDHLTAKLP
jgi:hypothetical protein